MNAKRPKNKWTVQRHPTGGIAMLQRLSDEVRACYQHAKDCARNAAAQSDPTVRQSFLDAQQGWLKLVRRLAAAPELEGN
jgi:hypothetical protein